MPSYSACSDEGAGPPDRPGARSWVSGARRHRITILGKVDADQRRRAGVRFGVGPIDGLAHGFAVHLRPVATQESLEEAHREPAAPPVDEAAARRNTRKHPTVERPKGAIYEPVVEAPQRTAERRVGEGRCDQEIDPP